MAVYEYNSALEEINVTPDQAFLYEEYLDKLEASRKASERIVPINEHFAIMDGHKFSVMKRGDDGNWYYMISTVQKYYEHCNKTLTCNEYVEFGTYEEAIDFINGFIGFLQWMSGIAASTVETEEETYEDMLAAQYNERLAGQVIYYTENVDQSERVARLLKASRDGVLLADPASPSDPGCWYSFSQVSHIVRGRQSGWEGVKHL